jgi:hexosaminidase
MRLKLLAIAFMLTSFSFFVGAIELDLPRPTRRLLPLPQKTTTNYDEYFFFDSFTLTALSETDEFGLSMYIEEISPFEQKENSQKRFIIGSVKDIASDTNLSTELAELIQLVPENDEGYVLEVTSDKVVIIGRNSIGTYWGLKTLAQLTDEVDGTKVAVGARIIDYPSLKYRGLQDDISRGPITNLDYMKTIVKQMSELKLNVFALYMELHVLEGVGKNGEIFSIADFAELVEFASNYHVEIIPSIQTFGHNLNFLRIPEFMKFSNNPGSSSCTLDPTNPEVYEFLDEVIGRYAAVSTSDYIHINCDEVWELGYGKSGALAKEIGGISEVYLNHLLKVVDIVNKHGKTAMFWNDMALNHRELISRLPTDAVVVNWHYMESASIPDRLKPFADEGLRQWGAPGLSNWNTNFPSYNHSYYNVRDYASQLIQHNGEGILVTTWDDDGETLFGPNWFGVALSAEAAWKGGKTDYSGLRKRFGDVVVGAYGSRIGDAIEILAGSTQYTHLSYEKGANVLFNMDPFATLDIYGMRKNAPYLLQAEEKVLKIVADTPPAKNSFMIESLPYVAKRVGTFGRKLQMTEKVIHLVNEAAATNNKALLLQAKEEIDAFLPHLIEVRTEFERLWLIENIPYYLNNIKNRYQNFENILLKKSQDLANYANFDIVPSVSEMGFPKVDISK